MPVDMSDRKDRPAYVTFHRVPVEDTAGSKEAGHYVAKDVDYVHITPAYFKDVMKFKVTQWFDNMKRDIAAGRMPQEWADAYKKQYEAWQNGQELPLSGSPIKGWGVISPAQQETLVRMNVLTVEDLARVNDEGIRRIGMGAIDLKNKAQAWLNSINDHGSVVMENASLKKQVSTLEGSVGTLSRQVEELMRLVKVQGDVAAVQPSAEITASDILDEHDTGALGETDMRHLYKQKFGKAPHPDMKPETLAARVKE
jgi:DNA-binding FrmR family transcriptional regulator